MNLHDSTVNVVISGSGMAVPPLSFSNEDICDWHKRKSPEWIYEKFGIRRRHARFDFKNNRIDNIDEDDLAYHASLAALNDAGADIRDIQHIILVSSTPTHIWIPDPSCILHDRLGAPEKTHAMMHIAGCAGMLNGLLLANGLIRSGQAENVLVCAANSLTSFCRADLVDKMWLFSCIFGDAAAALVVSGRRRGAGAGEEGFSHFHMGSNRKIEVAEKKFGGTKHMPSPDNVAALLADYPNFDFKKVPSNINTQFSHVHDEVLAGAGLRSADADWVLFNNGNGVLQRQWLQERNIPETKALFNIDKYGNAGAASFGLVAHEFRHAGRAKPGDLALFMSVGTGIQFGGVLYRFG